MVSWMVPDSPGDLLEMGDVGCNLPPRVAGRREIHCFHVVFSCMRLRRGAEWRQGGVGWSGVYAKKHLLLLLLPMHVMSPKEWGLSVSYYCPLSREAD